jgi:xanthine/CO dehydrogenase XdhC/CoxF family maturation factor
MKEIRKILDVYQHIDFSQRKAALATVVRVEGSSYRRPGARMLMTDDGRWEGGISGGCLEGDALRKARQVILDGTPMLVTYDTMEGGAASLGVGLGCNGIIDVLIEPIEKEDRSNPIEILRAVVQVQETCVLTTVFKHSTGEPALGNRILFRPDGTVTNFADTEAANLEGMVEAEVAQAFSSGKSRILTCETALGQVDIFIEVLHPSINLILFGGGFDAVPIIKIAKELGWHVTVSDDCVAHLSPKRFPEADAVVHADRHAVTTFFSFTRRTAAVLMSHNYKYDLAVLTNLLPTDVSYIGILGPKKRFDKMIDELTIEGRNIPADQIASIYSPVGLDIGAETPEEIALSIVAEIKAHFSGKAGSFLKNKKGPIHERISTEMESAQAKTLKAY